MDFAYHPSPRTLTRGPVTRKHDHFCLEYPFLTIYAMNPSLAVTGITSGDLSTHKRATS